MNIVFFPNYCGPCGNYLCTMYGCQRTAPCYQPTTVAPNYTPLPHGCICPPTSEQTCQNPVCPRKARTNTALEEKP